MNINPSYETIGSIFEKNILFEVPKYQRYYAWDDEQVDDFVKDFKKVYQSKDDDNIEHFFGGIVAVKKPIPGSNRQQRELIDGQQRITTTILLIVNVINKFLSLKTSDNQEMIDSFVKQLREKYLIYNDRINRAPIIVPKLALSDADRQYFDDVINYRTPVEIRDSHLKIRKAYNKLSSFVDEMVDKFETFDDKIDALSEFDNTVHNKCTIIFIDADTRDSAYKLFQVLNDRGAGLTEGDLLKSKTLEVLDKYFPVKQESLQKSWDIILSDEPKQVETFLRYYFASVCGYRVGRATMYDEFLMKFFPTVVNKDEINNESEAIEICDKVSELLSEMRNFRKISNGEWPYTPAQPVGEWDRRRLYVLVNYLNFDIVYPLLLAATKLEQKKFFEIVYMVEKFMFRYKSVCNLGHQKISDIYMKEAVKIRENPSAYRTSSLRNQLKTIVEEECNDEVFKVGIANLKYRPTGGNKQLKYFFSMLSCHLEWISSGATGRPTPSKTLIPNFDDITIEHIFSQSPSAPQLFKDDDIHRIKNLTVLTPDENVHVANKPYTEKKVSYLASEYKINQYFTDVSDWTSTAIDEWQNYLTDLSCKIFVI